MKVLSHRGTRRWVLAAAVLATLASVAGPARPASAQATTRPILIVNGHAQPEASTDAWADELADRLGMTPAQTDGVALAAQGGLLFWPGTASNEVSAGLVHTAIDNLYAANGNTPIDIIAVSHGSPVVRWLIEENPSNVRSKIAGLVSLSGANLGVPSSDSIFLDWCEDYLDDEIPVCEEMVYDAWPGHTAWLEAVNNAGYHWWGEGYSTGDPTPGDIDYFYIYSEITPEGTDEGTLAYDWTEPLPGADDMSAQDACPGNPDRVAPHAGFWPDTTGPDRIPNPDLVMSELVVDALHRDPLVIDEPDRCDDQVDED